MQVVAGQVVAGLVAAVAVGWLVADADPLRIGACAAMSVSAGCSSAGAAAVAGGLAIAIGARAGWLGAAVSRRVRALPRAALPSALARVARRAGAARVRGVAAQEPVAFCAGLLRPRVYVSTGLVAAVAGDELAAVLAHEAAHARRRDPLRGLLIRACADVVFFAPLLRWYQQHRHIRAELAADRAATAHAGTPALAGALLRLTGPTLDPSPAAAPAEMPAFGPDDAALEVRVAALTATPTGASSLSGPHRSAAATAAVTTAAGLLAVGGLSSCLPMLLALLGGQR